MGRTGISPFLAAAFVLLAAWGARAEPTFMFAGKQTSQPVGHYELCLRSPAECNQTTALQAPVPLTRHLWDLMVGINNRVNTAVAPVTDMERWGVEEYWSYPDRSGDCEDYVLEKRRLLMKAGVPAGNLLITVVRQANGDGHAVLTVNTSMGDFVLDNLEPSILAWTDTGYRFLKRQSTRSSGVWVSVDEGRSVAVGSVSAKR